MSKKDAIRLAAREHSPGEINVHLTKIGHGVTFRGSTTDVKCFEKVFLANEYQSPFDLKPSLIIDAGANIGMASLYFASRYPKATIVAIEPEAANFRMLQRNCQGLSNIILIHGALWPESTNLRINDPDSEAWTFSVSEAKNGTATDTVSAVTIADIMRHTGSTRIDLLKLDIEGAEVDLFSRGNLNWIDQVDCMVIELHDRLRPGCAQAFYSQLVPRNFTQEVRGENIFVQLSAPQPTGHV